MAKMVQPDPGARLDRIDQQLVDLLQKDGRMPNATLAREVGVAESRAWCGCAPCVSAG